MARKKLWGGRFAEEEDPLFAAFNDSLSFDRELIDADIEGSIAWSRALERAGVITRHEQKKLSSALGRILKEHRRDPRRIRASRAEDVHTYVELSLRKSVGALALKLHTGRSRNDQVATDMRIHLKRKCRDFETAINRLLRTIAGLANRHPTAVLPGYTHLQGAQPVLLAHYLLSYGEMFLRDRERLRQLVVRLDVCPLGSGALAGTVYRIDRKALALDLGFRAASENSMDAVSDRDFVLDLLCFASILMMHMSRLSEDLILYGSSEFAFVRMSDRVASGSSLMPQKKNPDALELIRGKTGRVYGHLMAMLTVLKGLPMTYNKDLQEDKEGLFDTIRSVTSCLQVLDLVLGTIEFRADRMRSCAAEGYLGATDLADYLVARKVPFRDAHGIAGRVVRRAVDLGVTLEKLSLDEYRRISPLFRRDLYACLRIESLVARRAETGGTAPIQVRNALRRFERRIGG
jgi:argininosuccinate lyase